MTAVLKQPKGRQGGWTPVKCLEQSAKLRADKIWLKSTGPRTASGKSKSSMNACKPGYEERKANRLRRRYLRNFLRLNKMFRDAYVLANRASSVHEKVMAITNCLILKNELGNLYKKLGPLVLGIEKSPSYNVKYPLIDIFFQKSKGCG